MYRDKSCSFVVKFIAIIDSRCLYKPLTIIEIFVIFGVVLQLSFLTSVT